jgi:Ohr subfamily peroxiredoxin
MKPPAPTAPPLSLLDKYVGQDIQPLYTTTVTVTGGEAEHGRASGVARSDDGNLELALRLPPELGGPGGGTNPEQLFAAGFAACFHGVLYLLAARAGLSAAGCSVEVAVSFARDPVDGMYLLMANVKIRLPGLRQATAEELVRNAERVCPYAKMAREGLLNVVTVVA